VNAGLVDVRVSEDLLDGFEDAAEKALAKFLEVGTSKRCVEINTVVKEVDFNIS
jgi:hypothetical protein